MKAKTTFFLAAFALTLLLHREVKAQFRGTNELSHFQTTTSYGLSMKDSNSVIHSEHVEKSKARITAPSSIYLEIGGAGIFYSINYDRLLTNNVALRFGFGYFGVPFLASLTAVPLTLSWFPFSNSTSPNKLEIGAGFDYINATVTPFFGDTPTRTGSAVCLTGILGYRYQAPDGGFMFRAAFTPILFTDELQSLVGISNANFAPWAGISFGTGF
jgi:hypothetical protein